MTILGIDPGLDKIGWAFVDYGGDLLLSGIYPASEQELFLTALARGSIHWERELSPWVREKTIRHAPRHEELSVITVGNGTGSLEAVKLFERLGVQIIVVDESETTLEARELYWILHPPSWWQRCLPRVMRFPTRPLDDLAAWAIAKRSFGII